GHGGFSRADGPRRRLVRCAVPYPRAAAGNRPTPVERARARGDRPGVGVAAMGATSLREIDCNGPGIARKGAGRGFYYVDADGDRIDDEDTLARIRDLAIPPAWTDVWICSDPLGHIQATGTDDKGRRQYRYHTRWQEKRAREKHER